jgi:hypothetical protein
MTDKWLPIGTVVALQGSERLFMIYGRAQMDADTNERWDYIACPYPEGNIAADQSVLFNKDLVERLFFVGYQTTQELDLANSLDTLVAKATA